MTALARSPEDGRVSSTETCRRCRWLGVALGVVAMVAVVLGAIVLWGGGDQDDSLAVPTALDPRVDEVIDTYALASENHDLDLLRTVVTPGYELTIYAGVGRAGDVWTLERVESWWADPNATARTFAIERVGPPIVRGTDPWYVSEVQIHRNTEGVTQLEGIATFVVVDDDGTLKIDATYWATQPEPLTVDPNRPVNDEATRAEFEQWLVGRFVAAGLDPPDVDVTWLPPSLDCREEDSHAQRSDPESGESHSVTLCFDDPELLVDGTVDGRWSPTAARFGLHEFAHVWMYDHLDDQTRAAFTERAGLEEWRGDGQWGELGVEHAAETIAWGVAGSDAARYDIEPEPDCTELTARFELLTGRPPLTSCTT